MHIINGHVDRDFYLDYNYGLPIKGDQLYTLTVWWQNTARLKQGTYSVLKIPQEIIFEVDVGPKDFDKWMNNKTEVDCTVIQGLSGKNIKCYITSLICDRIWTSPMTS